MDALAAHAPAGSVLDRRLAQVRGWITAGNGEPAAAFAGLADWSRAMGLPGLSALGVGPHDLGGIATAAATASSMRASPVVFGEDQLVAILQAATD